MPQRTRGKRGQIGPRSLLALLALGAGSVAAETLPPLRINPALLGNGTPPAPAAPQETAKAVSAPPAVIPVEPAPTARIDLAPQQTTVAPALVAKAPVKDSKAKTGKAARVEAVQATPRPVSPTPTAPAAPAPMAASVEPQRRPEEASPAPAPLPAISRQPETPPEVAERPAIPPLYSAHIAAGELPDTVLKGGKSIVGHAKLPGEELPTFIAADHIAGKNDVEVVATGNVELRKRNSILESDRLTYWQADDVMEAEGNVRLSREGDRIRGPKMRMKNSDSTGFFEQPEYSIRRVKTGSAATVWTGNEELPGNLTTGTGAATRMDFEGEGHYRLTDATYSTCKPVAGKDPDWFARTSSLRLNYDDEVGTATNATLYFKGMPILYSPWMSFSLNHERKSGLLSPTYGSTSRGGMEFTQPVYWNIAPNKDATIAPRIMAKRGTLWNGEYRYLEPNYRGVFQGQYISEDKLERKRRSSYSLAHSQSLGYGFSGSLDLNGASDGTFFSDLSNSTSVVSQTYLLRQGTLSYGSNWWSANLLTQSYQVLQDPSLPPVSEPYRRQPQLTISANRSDLPGGLTFGFSGEHVSFRHPTQVQARRFMLYPQLSLPLQTAAFYITPKVGIHSTRYSLDRQAAGVADKLTRNVPIYSVDSGVTFERETDWFGKSMTQTLEPRLYYLYVPVRDQNQIPVFDTGATGFDFAQIFSESRYGGGDRIGDANQATAMLTSRLLDTKTGEEILRAAFGQRFYFSTQNVGLPGEVLRTDRQTDFLGAFSGRVLPKTYVDMGVQYNPRNSRMERINLGGRYQPESGKVLNAGYRYTRDQLGQVDVSGQWPIFGGWHAVGRVNYSTKDRRMIETVAGLEFDGGCWVARVVMQRIATQTQQSNTAMFFQLEFNDFARIGSNPLELLKRNVPGYGIVNQTQVGSDPSSPTSLP